MADENGGDNPMQLAIFVFGGFIVLVILWVLAGGPAKTDLRGIFLNPPKPVGTGGAYGPQISSTTIDLNNY